MQANTLAEILRTAGYHAAVVDGETPRDHELALEASFLDFRLCYYSMQRQADEDSPYTFVVSDATDAEEVVHLIEHFSEIKFEAIAHATGSCTSMRNIR